MDRVLGPYLAGGGAAAYKSNFQALSTDLLVSALSNSLLWRPARLSIVCVCVCVCICV